VQVVDDQECYQVGWDYTLASIVISRPLLQARRLNPLVQKFVPEFTVRQFNIPILPKTTRFYKRGTLRAVR
jgi:hypothetical protein